MEGKDKIGGLDREERGKLDGLKPTTRSSLIRSANQTNNPEAPTTPEEAYARAVAALTKALEQFVDGGEA